MKYLAFILIFLQSCGKETPPIVRVDNCPLCSSSIEINNAEWEAKPYYALFTTNNANDSTFTIEINEITPLHDAYEDGLIFWDIPYRSGEYQIDSTFIETNFFTFFEVFETEDGTHTQAYYPILNGQSSITIDSINKQTGDFKIHFNLILFADGEENAVLYNSTFPNKIEVIGFAEGTITSE